MGNITNHIVIGAGEHMTKAHLRFLNPSHAKRLNIFDPGLKIREGAKSMSKLEVPCRLFPTDKAAIESEGDVVWIGSPDRFHLEQLKAAIRAGKHVFVEKPLVTKVSELDGLRLAFDEAKKKGLKILTCHPRRLDPPFVWLKEMIPSLEKKYGKVLSVGFDFTYHEPSADWKLGRSLLLDHVNHEIDLVNFLVGPAKTSATKQIDGFDRYEVTGVREDGVTVALSGTRRLKGRIYDEQMRVRFERAEMILYATSGMCVLNDHEKRVRIERSVPKTNYDVRNRAVTKNFLGYVSGLAEPYLTDEEMLFNAEFGVRLMEEGRV